MSCLIITLLLGAVSNKQKKKDNLKGVISVILQQPAAVNLIHTACVTIFMSLAWSRVHAVAFSENLNLCRELSLLPAAAPAGVYDLEVG